MYGGGEIFYSAFWDITSVLYLLADVSEHLVGSIFYEEMIKENDLFHHFDP
jgi:hypothetical protein